MNLLHHHLTNKSPLYNRWHHYKYHPHVHWVSLAIVFLLSISIISGAWSVAVKEENKLLSDIIRVDVARAQTRVPIGEGLTEMQVDKTIPAIDINDALDFAVGQLSAYANGTSNYSQYPRSTDSSDNWKTVGANDWTSGFFPGLLWMAYEHTHDTKFKTWAERWTRNLRSQKDRTDTHDLGFMFYDSYGQGYRLTNNSTYPSVLMDAANALASRYDSQIGLIKSWDWGSWNYPVIIDNMMNLELLFWAADNGGGQNMYDMAVSHADKTRLNHFRTDNSTYHVVDYNSDGSVASQETQQGAGDETTWARGQAWAIYGFAMVYRETGEQRFLTTAKNAADYFINNLPVDNVPYWDFNRSGEERDTSAAAIAAAGLLELSSFSTGADQNKYFMTAENILASLIKSPYIAKGSGSDAVLLHGVGNKPKPDEIDVSLVYGDYYFMEALLRYKNAVSVPPLPPQLTCTVTANTISDLQAKISQANSGDTVCLAAGDYTLDRENAPIEINNKSITLKGAGKDMTTIRSSSNDIMIVANCQNKTGLRITGVNFTGSGSSLGGIRIENTCKDFRIDNNIFMDFLNDSSTTGAINISWNGLPSTGVIDQNRFIDNKPQDIVVFSDGLDSYRNNTYWKKYETYKAGLGNADAVYIEGNYFSQSNKTASSITHHIIANYGSRYVFRYNKIEDETIGSGAIDAHGKQRASDPYNHGTRSYEIYGNTVTAQDRWKAVTIRGGDGVIFNNNFNGGYNSSKPILIQNEDSAGGAGGNCSYPCANQIRELFVWGNKLNGTPMTISNFTIRTSNVLQENRDYFLMSPGDAAIGGFIPSTREVKNYQPFVCPHPLVDDYDSINNDYCKGQVGGGDPGICTPSDEGKTCNTSKGCPGTTGCQGNSIICTDISDDSCPDPGGGDPGQGKFSPDLNCDNKVNVVDFGILLSWWGPFNGGYSHPDCSN